MKFTQSYISITIDGRNSYHLDKRTKPNSILWFNVKDEEKEESIKKLMESKGIIYNFNRYKDFVLTIDENFFDEHMQLMSEIHSTRYKEYQTEN